MTKDLHRKVVAALTKSGFPLEMRIAAVCAEAGFEVQQRTYYIDQETGAPREIDIVASLDHMSNTSWLRFSLVIECKARRYRGL